MFYLKIISLVFASSGLWKLAELLIQHHLQNRKRKAEIRQLNLNGNATVIKNWMEWSAKMESKIKELESKNKALFSTIIKQRDRISQLEKLVCQLEKR